MNLRALKNGFYCGLLYGLGILIFEDLIAGLINEIEFTTPQLIVSLVTYPLFFGICGAILGLFFSMRNSRLNVSTGAVILSLSIVALYFFGYRDVAYRLLPLAGKLQLFTIALWGLVVIIILWSILKWLRKSSEQGRYGSQVCAAALGIALTSFLILNVKLDYDPITAAKFGVIDPWWRILAFIFGLGIYFVARAALSGQIKDEAKAPKGSKKFLLIGILLVAVSVVSAKVLSWTVFSKPIIQVEQTWKENIPNVIFILIDTFRADHTSLAGYERDTTPILKEYSRRGIVFNNAFSNSSWTIPSVTSFLTSRYPGMNPVEKWFDDLPTGLTTLQETLGKHDYYCKGVSSNFHLTARNKYDRGFHEFTYLPGHGVRQLLYFPSFISDRIPTIYEFGHAAGYVDGGIAYGKARAMNREIIPWLAKNNDTRFFLYAHYMDPHIPYFPPKRVFSKGELLTLADFRGLREFHTRKTSQQSALKVIRTYTDRYDDEILYLDGELKDLFATLDDLNLWENSLIIVTSDHGEEFLDHGFGEHGHGMYQEVIHVPLIIFFPDGRGAGETIERQVDLLDLAPTIYDYIGIEPTETLEGSSLLPLIAGEEDLYSGSRKKYFGQVLPQRPDWHLKAVYTTIDGDYKAILNIPEDPERPYLHELFDLRADPAEQSNLTDELPDLASSLFDTIAFFRNYCDSLRIEEGALGETLTPDELERLRALGYVR